MATELVMKCGHSQTINPRSKANADQLKKIAKDWKCLECLRREKLNNRAEVK